MDRSCYRFTDIAGIVDMENRLFSDDHLNVLLQPSEWRIIGSRIGADAEPLPNSVRLAWARANTHRHAHREILVVLCGRGEYGYLGARYPCSPGTVFLLDSFEEHDNGYPPGCPDGDHLWVSAYQSDCIFRLVSIRNGAARLSGLWSHLLGLESTGIASLDPAFGATDGFAASQDMRVLRSRSVLSLLGLGIVQKGYALPEIEGSVSSQGKVIAAIRQYIRDTAGNGVSLDVLSQMSGYSKYHFHRLFKQHVGATVHDYVDACRATKLDEMVESGCSMKQIAAALGFSCQSAFSRWRKNARG
jgi:AraC-like DNA-binding protein